MEDLAAAAAAPLRQILDELKTKFGEFQGQEPLLSVILGFIQAINWQVGAGALALCV